jgi:hypothetical protein
MIFACCADDADSGSDKTADAGKTTSDSGTRTADSATCEQASGTADNTAAVVKAADALVAALIDAQKNAIQYEKTLANRQKWSNFPTTFVQRNIHRA